MSGDQRDTRFPTRPSPTAPQITATSPPPRESNGDALSALRSATSRLVRTVDGIADHDWDTPSRLPGWSRAHVVAHLAVDAEGLSGAVVGILEDEPVALYHSSARRDADIARLATASPSVLRDRLLGSATELARALSAITTIPELGDTGLERTPGGAPSVRVSQVPMMRRREVEIHHVDLALGYGESDWPEEFVQQLLDARAAGYDGPPFRAHATDLDAYWVFGVNGATAPDDDAWPHPTIRGPASALARWSTGRSPDPRLSPTGHPGPWRADPASDVLICEGGELPRMEGM